MQVGDLVNHWRSKLTGIVIAKKTFTRHYLEWEVVWTDGTRGFYTPDRLEVVCK